MAGVIKNYWPCCAKPTRFHNIEQYVEGDILENKKCPKCGTQWRVTFVGTSLPSMPGILKMVWEKIGSFRKEAEVEA